MTSTSQLERSPPPARPRRRADAGGEDPGARKWWMLGAVSVSTFMLLLDITVVNVALPRIQGTLHSSFSDLQWVIDAYALTLAALLVGAGSLADVAGRRRIFVAGVALFTLASLACGAAPTQLVLNLARAVQGIGGAAIYAVAPAMIANDFHGRQRGLAFGISGGITGLAVALGPLLGGALTAVSWRWVFFLNVPLGIAVVAVALARVRESRDPSRRSIDWAGIVVFSLALVMLVFALIRGGRDGWSAAVYALVAGAVVAFAAFVAIERSRREPMFDLELFRNRSFNGLSLSTLGINATINVAILFQVLLLENVMGFSPLATGLRYLPLTVAVFVVAAVAGALSTSVAPRLMVGLGCACFGAGLLLMHGVAVGDSWTVLLPGMIVCGLGIGLFNPTRAATAVALVRPERAGMASGISEMFQQGGVAIGVAAIGSIALSRMRETFSSALGGRLDSSHGAAALARLASGDPGRAVRSVPPGSRAVVEHATHQALVDGLHQVLLVGAGVAFASAIVGAVLLRRSDLHPDAGAG